MITTDKLLELVDNFISVIYQETGFPVVIYDINGRIIRATDISRVGDMHAGAERIMCGELSECAIDAAEAAINPLVREGFSCPIIIDGTIVAGFGITGKLELVTPLARIATNTITAWIKEQETLDQLARSEKKFRNIFNHSLHGIFQSSRSGRFLTANPALAKILGYSSNQELTTSITDIASQLFVDAGDRQQLLDLLRQRPVVEGFHTRFKRRDGEVIDVRINAKLLYDSESGAPYLEGIIEDITEKIRTDTALKLSEEKFSKAFNNCPVWVVLSSLASGRYIDVNESFLRTMGYTRREIIDRTSLEIGSWVDPSARRLIVDTIRKYDKVEGFEVRRQTRNGDILDMLFWGEAIEIGGEECLLSVSLDITASKIAEQEKSRLEQALAHSQKLDAVGQLAGGIAHDFNNMLGGIMGAAEMLSHQTGSNPQAKKLSQMILDAAGRAADLTSKLLTFSRGTQPTSTTVDIHEIIKETVLLLQNTIDRRIGLEIDLAAPSSVIVGDPSQLQNSLLNMGINSSHAMPDGGTISISTKETFIDTPPTDVSVSQPQQGKYVQIDLTDSGCGIPPEYIDKIFDPFFTTKEQGQGTGLGLAAVYGTVIQHKGSITVASKPGDGTTFSLLLPLSEDQRIISQTATKIERGNGRILVVDDEEVMRLTAKAILEDLGYEPVLAADGQEALKIYEKAPEAFDLVLLDMVMPKMNGRDCFASLRQLDPKVRVVLSSGFSNEDDFHEMKAGGLKGFINKPYRLAALSQILSKALQE